MADEQRRLPSLVVPVIVSLRLPRAAICCHFFARITAQRSELELQTVNCWCKATGGTPQLESWQDITTELRNALSTSSDAFLLSKHMTYSITTASQGSVILPSPANPNSSCDILRSSPKTVVLRYGNGTLNRLPSAVYTAQWPLSATGEFVQQASSSLAAVVLTLCSLLAS
uniref:Uncharacterized protein n=1 Tax=Oryza rufipogon TaxID=4529 RepID=A0A0E0QUL3_ORYRU